MYAVYSHSHWQGSGPGRQLATGTREQCQAVADTLSTCSFCTPGRTSSYSVGTCYRVAVTRRPHATQLPQDVADWSREDLEDLIHGARLES